MLQTTKCSGGINLMCENVPWADSVVVGIWIPRGSSCEEPDKYGIMHFIEHMLFKGTKTRSAVEISKSIESYGGNSNAFTSESYTGYYVHILKEYASFAIDILFDMYFNSVFDASEVERERGVILEEIKMYSDDPASCAGTKFMEYNFSKAMGHSVMGYSDTVSGFTRDDLYNCYKNSYRTDEMLIAVVGNVDIYDIRIYADSLFYNYIKNDKKIKPYKYNKNRDFFKPSVDIVKKDVEQVHMFIVGESVDFNNKDKYVTSLIDVIFGCGSSSRLFVKIREEMGLAYSISCFSQYSKNMGFFAVYGATGCETFKKMFGAVVKEINLLKDKGVTAEELEKAKIYCKSALLMSGENLSSRFDRIGRNFMFGSQYKENKEIVDIIDSITLKDIKRVINKIMNTNKMGVTVLGNFKSDSAIKRYIKGLL